MTSAFQLARVICWTAYVDIRCCWMDNSHPSRRSFPQCSYSSWYSL